jgi:hypothetical protein
MALSAGEKTQVLALIAREGGLKTLVTEIQDAYTADANAAAVTALTTAITVTVASWPTVISYVSTAKPNLTVATVLNEIDAAASTQTATKLGPLFVALYLAAKTQIGR